MEQATREGSSAPRDTLSEGFRPVSNTRQNTLVGKLKFYGRMLLDLQILTIFRDVRAFMPPLSGDVLDVGCGQSPYRFLLDKTKTRYHGIDIADAEKFDYSNSEITPFNGKDIPFGDNSCDAIVCTEVLEHVFDHESLVAEMHRVLKPGGIGLITVPWSARYHYIPHDYFRYTPSALKNIFGRFSSATITPRGSDISVIANKLIVLWARNLALTRSWKLVLLPLWIAGIPLVLSFVGLAHISLLYRLGSTDDPLGYTVVFRK